MVPVEIFNQLLFKIRCAPCESICILVSFSSRLYSMQTQIKLFVCSYQRLYIDWCVSVEPKKIYKGNLPPTFSSII